jgi:GTP pyrophosphokinase
MIAVTRASSTSPTEHPAAALSSRMLARLSATIGAEELRLIDEVGDFAVALYGDARAREGDRYVDRAFGAAAILADLRLDHLSIAAALLCVAPQVPNYDDAAVRERFGAELADMVQGVARMEQIHADVAQAATMQPEERAQQAEALRKMLLAMVQDIRVVLVKLAERTQVLRFLMAGDETIRRATAREVLDLFAPLANRLGVWQIKWELEDLSLRALEPATYKQIARLLDEKREDRQRYIDNIIATLKRELHAAGIAAEVSGRPKHIYSIYNKMRRKQVAIEDLYDIRAVRVLVEDIKDCYTVLGLVHNLWTPLQKEFDDYIAKPKPNNYRSLHTAVIGPEGKALEVQIRTYEMHYHSEYGVAAHWRYKEGGTAATMTLRDPGFDEKIGWLRQILDWKDEVADAGELLQQFKSSLFTEVIYVLTPQGKVVDLPRGATPVDFAYHVHTNLGHRCRGAKVDGNMVPLDYALQNGQRVEIITAKQGGPEAGPSRDWLNPNLGFMVSNRAKSKVRQWFKSQQLEATVAHGRVLVEKELQREGQTAIKLEQVAQHAGFAKLDDFFAAVARGEIGPHDLRNVVRTLAHADAPAAEPAADEDLLMARKSRAVAPGSGILIVGVDKLMTGLARCCKPAPPDPIIGFITRGKGITIHRRSCSNVARIDALHPERLITADWGAQRDEVFPVDIEVIAADRPGLLRDISEVFSREKINVTAVNTLSKHLQARMLFTIEIRGLEQLAKSLAQIREVSGVLETRRR